MAEKLRYPVYDAEKYRLSEMRLSSNPQTRVPVVLCIDCSYSMRQGGRLREVMRGVETFRKKMLADPIAQDSVEVAIISYGGSQAVIEQEFAPVGEMKAPQMEASGGTPLADAVELSVEILEELKTRYEDNGLAFYRPWIIFMGDGDDDQSGSRRIFQAARQLKELYDTKQLNVLCITVGERTRIECSSLMAIAPDGKVQFLADMKFDAFFAWLSTSMQKVSNSLCGEDVIYPTSEDWAELLERGN